MGRADAGHNARVYDEGVVPVGAGIHAYLQPDGGFGLSNAGIVSGDGEALLVDTFFDLGHTRRLLEGVDRATGAPVRTVVNTHHNGDHCWGNQLVADAEIVGHRGCVEHFGDLTPELLQLLKSGSLDHPAAAYLAELMEPFDFSDIVPTPPGTVVDGDTNLDRCGHRIRLLAVGPAHTAGDLLVHLPEDGVLFTGDIVFRLCAPLAWEGTFDKWIAALELVEGLDVETVVPGHGPIGGTEVATDMREYLQFVRTEATTRHARGLSLFDAARDIELGPYGSWGEPERVVSLVERAYREVERGEQPDTGPDDFLALAAWMGEHRA